ncbi:MAG TPA: GNAT family N-acetyltransferase, partial [Candidatus Omnitrophota bacterium]|nr:GNAT family N-acetyltransferase [Candidatus Omnitrophota bacterium]
MFDVLIRVLGIDLLQMDRNVLMIKNSAAIRFVEILNDATPGSEVNSAVLSRRGELKGLVSQFAFEMQRRGRVIRTRMGRILDIEEDAEFARSMILRDEGFVTCLVADRYDRGSSLMAWVWQGNIVGYGSYVLSEHHSAWIGFCIFDEYRGQGLGSRAYSKLISITQNIGRRPVVQWRYPPIAVLNKKLYPAARWNLLPFLLRKGFRPWFADISEGHIDQISEGKVIGARVIHRLINQPLVLTDHANAAVLDAGPAGHEPFAYRVWVRNPPVMAEGPFGKAVLKSAFMTAARCAELNAIMEEIKKKILAEGFFDEKDFDVDVQILRRAYHSESFKVRSKKTTLHLDERVFENPFAVYVALKHAVTDLWLERNTQELLSRDQSGMLKGYVTVTPKKTSLNPAWREMFTILNVNVAEFLRLLEKEPAKARAFVQSSGKEASVHGLFWLYVLMLSNRTRRSPRQWISEVVALVTYSPSVYPAIRRRAQDLKIYADPEAAGKIGESIERAALGGNFQADIQAVERMDSLRETEDPHKIDDLFTAFSILTWTAHSMVYDGERFEQLPLPFFKDVPQNPLQRRSWWKRFKKFTYEDPSQTSWDIGRSSRPRKPGTTNSSVLNKAPAFYQPLSSTEACEAARKLVDEMGYGQRPVAFDFNFSDQRHQIELFFDSLEANVLLRLDGLFFIPLDAVDVESFSPRSREIFRRYAGNIIFFSPSSYGSDKTIPLSPYAQIPIIAMLHHIRHFKDSIVVDFGSGDGLLARTALRLGAKAVVLIERDEELVELAETMMVFDNRPDEEYIILNEDLTDADLLKRLNARKCFS